MLVQPTGTGPQVGPSAGLRGCRGARCRRGRISAGSSALLPNSPILTPMRFAASVSRAVLGYLGAHIADFKIPQYIAVSTTPLPRNPGGKLLKRHLRDNVDWSAATQR